MTSEELHSLLQNGRFPFPAPKRQLIETHISWVILSDSYAYKIKKPIDYSFLDFSTLEKRHYYCLRELELNRRLTEGMYLDVLPIRQEAGAFTLMGKQGSVVEYALLMRRMDNTRQMDKLLSRGLVTRTHMLQIARRLAAFHRNAERVPGAEEAEMLYADFADLNSVSDAVSGILGADAAAAVRSVVAFAGDFLHRHRRRLRRRHQLGWVIDGHGDLHSRNILLLDKPVIFDCIEFNDQLRTLDVLNEIAFFCMDLDYFGFPRLAEAFRTDYLNRMAAVQTAADRELFQYYKLYRANVRLKVNCLRSMQPDPGADLGKVRQAVRAYHALFIAYYRQLLDKGRGGNGP